MTEDDLKAPYGYCPRCGQLGIARERRPNGNDRCKNGHEYPSRDAHKRQTFIVDEAGNTGWVIP